MSGVVPKDWQELQDWPPVGISELEPTARAALSGYGCHAVTAGPGAGKTEFLAQKAAYLLQTGLCPAPQRILAISYKRDAARNLRERVARRLPAHADRFVSMTFDAFTKSLVDRFSSALPPDWATTEPYNLTFWSQQQQSDFAFSVAALARGPLRSDLFALPQKTFLAHVVGAWDLPVTLLDDRPSDPVGHAAMAWWKAHYLDATPPNADFVMLNRLAELLVRTVPQLRRALRLTYPVIFVDEFQDTNVAQFSLLRSVFGEHTAITAVGDAKQRIMGFAGALGNAFPAFIDRFDATEHPLAWNFRSSDALVELQHVIARRLDPTSVVPVSKAPVEHGHEPVALWIFPDQLCEADHIANRIARDIAGSHRTAADFALVARQKIDTFVQRFGDRLAQHGIRVRNDDAKVGKLRLQVLLASDVTRLLIGLLGLSADDHGHGEVWVEVSGLLQRMRGAAGDEHAEREVSDDLATVVRRLHSWLDGHPVGSVGAIEVVDQVLALLGRDEVDRYFTAADRGEDFDDVVEAFTARLGEVTHPNLTWSTIFDNFESRDAVTMLTVHRSKGLEYHTVFFLSLDDEQWWSHSRDVGGSISAFFVGLSRAAQRLVFTTVDHARKAGIAELYTMLAQAGVPEHRCQ
ncbi:UvrD-helicase domain-containing protein [Kutzneria sp. CA-103260]|uniref:UvrD-helicase domain-containing protein n=1 Tax=Kutzneria sp. CA-103260 TaxID=2802641 RepID=UPI001BAE08E8|nr:ATP-dependent helicase [Kutzneria sp. CA-103260]QUQ64565.1 ATP-dependent DNA helicase PcrA [Kutzneria sp. CA-103260]